MKQCNRPCRACPFVKEAKLIKTNSFSWQIRKHVNCDTANIIYILECTKCDEMYIGESKMPLKEGISEHAQYVRSVIPSKATGEHFNRPGHSLSNMKFIILEQAKKSEDLYRKERETFFINKFRTFYNGINRID